MVGTISVLLKYPFPLGVAGASSIISGRGAPAGHKKESGARSQESEFRFTEGVFCRARAGPTEIITILLLLFKWIFKIKFLRNFLIDKGFLTFLMFFLP
jgi:hypothetical protein